MTLEQAKKRRSQGDLIDELVEALEPLSDYYTLPHKAFMEKYSHPNTSGQKIEEWLRERAVAARAVLEKAKEHDCIPIDDAKEVAAEGHRW